MKMKFKNTALPGEGLHKVSASLILKRLSIFIFCLLQFGYAEAFPCNTAGTPGNNRLLKEISGKVTDEDGAPLNGVSVSVKGGSAGTATNHQGLFKLQVPDNASALIFSFVGYVDQEIKLTDGSVFNIKMALLHDRSMEEVVVVGFGKAKKVNLTGSVSVIDAKDIESRSVTTVSQALQGLATGLEIGQSSYGGSLEGAFMQDFNIRGVNTIGQGSGGGPLILIDGAAGTLNHLSPNDIESISILKDAAASSIYGSRAPFGVILVTTKKGSKGRPVVVYNNNFRSTRPMNFPETADSYRWALFINDASNNSGAPDFVGPDRMQRIQEYIAGKPGLTNLPVDPGNPARWAGGSSEGNDNLDWWKVVFRGSAPAQEHTIGVRGGGDHVKYYISGNLLDQTGLLNLGGDALKRYNVTANLDADVSNWISFGFNGKFSREDYDRPSHFEDRFMQYMSRIQPANPLYDPNG
ncbi:MAG TPA: TonB-dependent receptor plug domain-containing protein, partial [Agriterribacter sp.]|nr:TonB-dependent receptor plug domain-containing protein [Agriterribacter sp.]